MSIAVECLVHLYDWCTALLMNMKQQLTSIRKKKTKHFRYGTILMTFFFENIPGLRPKVISSISSPRDPRIARWVDLMKRLGEVKFPEPPRMMSSSNGGENKSSPWRTTPMPGWISAVIQTSSFHLARHGAQLVKFQFLTYAIFWIFSIYMKKCENMFF